ncbi:hypothetical protein LOAG_01934 [Loa loa]|uniref:Uncharacterized protein n=1 Tax=Loa loa TaxID=7209 RepID=A0A1S0U7P4_LOALO|nr:hypothetical protein LOAG_01934 [Loa loa]EFO26542.1 hypothetical protein LOAG_01934 [Loa loa]
MSFLSTSPTHLIPCVIHTYVFTRSVSLSNHLLMTYPCRDLMMTMMNCNENIGVNMLSALYLYANILRKTKNEIKQKVDKVLSKNEKFLPYLQLQTLVNVVERYVDYRIVLTYSKVPFRKLHVSKKSALTCISIA